MHHREMINRVTKALKRALKKEDLQLSENYVKGSSFFEEQTKIENTLYGHLLYDLLSSVIHVVSLMDVNKKSMEETKRLAEQLKEIGLKNKENEDN